MAKLILAVGIPTLLYLAWCWEQMNCCLPHSASIGG